MKARRLARTLLLVCLFSTQGAQAGIFDDDEARKQVTDLRARVEQTAETQARAQLNLSTNLQALRDEIAVLRGQVEALTYRLETAERRQQDYYVDIDGRLRKLEPSAAAPADGQAAAAKSAKSDPAKEAQDYEKALNLFKAAKYRDSATAFDGFTKTWPDSSLTPAAQLWHGHSWFALQDCKRASDAYNVVLGRWPDSPKAPDALFALAECQPAKQANKTLETLIAKYPDSTAAKKAKQRLSGH